MRIPPPQTPSHLHWPSQDRIAAARPKLSILRPEVDSRLDGSHLVNVNGSLVVSSNDDSTSVCLKERKVISVKLM